MQKGNRNNTITMIALPVIFAFAMRFFFAIKNMENFYAVMGVTFLFFMPLGMGVLTNSFAPIEKLDNRAYRFFAPWVPVMVFFISTLLLKIEGWACWIMILPVFLIMSSVGGLVAADIRRKRNKNQKLYVSLFTLLPLLISPIEQSIGKIPARYEAFTYIDIKASKETIWSNVTRVKEIPEEQNKGWLTRQLGFPRPIKAELNYNGVGANRKAIFNNGLVFSETVLSYTDQQSMTFSIKANPYDIPSTTMDEHVVVGGKYFDVLDGTYELVKLDEHTYRLNLYSHFQLSTTFNFYAGLWAKLIMKDIQNNILQVIKSRSEHNNS